MKSLFLRLGALFLLATGLSLTSATLFQPTAHASTSGAVTISEYVPQLSMLAADPAQEPAPEDAEAEAPASSCVITGIGWIVCPIMRFMAEIVDAAYGYVRALLVVQPLLTTGQSQPAYQAWEIMRNFANVAFVVAFLMIIFSQVTSVGITNYGIKKLLPRIIIAAILVNVSFWVCAIAVDLSNIAGSSINGLFDSIRADLASAPNPDEENPFNSGDGWLGVTGAVLAGGVVAAGVAYATLSALIPAVIVALIAIVTVFLVLVIRQALIILLVIASPLAFVAFLLPNTESIFEKWRSLFQTLLLMFPIIAALFGASALASYIVMRSANGPYATVVQIAGALVAIAPLAITPLVMKTAGSLLGRISSIATRPVNSAGNKAKQYGNAYRDRRQAIASTRRLKGTSMTGELGKRMQERAKERNGDRFSYRGALGSALVSASRPGEKIARKAAERDIDNDQRNANASKALNEAKQVYVSESVTDQEGYAESIAGPTGDVGSVKAAAVALQRASMNKDVDDAQKLVSTQISGADKLAEALVEAVKNDDMIQAQAIQNQLFKSGGEGLKQYRNAMETISSDSGSGELLNNNASKEMRRNFVENHAGLKSKAADLMAQANGVDVTDENGNKSKDYRMAAATGSPGSWGMSDVDMSNQKGASLAAAANAGAFSQSAEEIAHFGAQAERILNTPQLAGNMDIANRKVLEGLRDAARQGAGNGGGASDDGTLRVEHEDAPAPTPTPFPRPPVPNPSPAPTPAPQPGPAPTPQPAPRPTPTPFPRPPVPNPSPPPAPRPPGES